MTNSYAQRTQYAVENIISLIKHEGDAAAELEAKLHGKIAESNGAHAVFMAYDLAEGVPHGLADAYFRIAARADKDAKELQAALEDTRKLASEELNELQVLDVSLQALAGTLLQIAKQGISITYKRLDSAPDGRHLNGIPLKSIIWHARNQAMHFEEGYNAQVKQLFRDLTREFGPEFDLNKHQGISRAKQIVKLLGWTDCDAYARDLDSLGL